MSILIPGMEMPKAGQIIEIAEGIKGTIYARISPGFDEWHSVIPVPPHGRLIDADNIDYPLMESEADEKWMHIAIDSAPTVIEAEEVYGQYTDTAGNFHWSGTHSGEHTVKAEDGET